MEDLVQLIDHSESKEAEADGPGPVIPAAGIPPVCIYTSFNWDHHILIYLFLLFFIICWSNRFVYNIKTNGEPIFKAQYKADGKSIIIIIDGKDEHVTIYDTIIGANSFWCVEGCHPYIIEACEHHMTGDRPPSSEGNLFSLLIFR